MRTASDAGAGVAEGAASSERWTAASVDDLVCIELPRSSRLLALMMGAANVIMQLSNPAVGQGVAHSRVRSGRLDVHPIKRTRTTLSYLAVAVLGTPDERRAYRRAVTRQHAQVRSDRDTRATEEYSALWVDLQKWVAACLFVGSRDVLDLVEGPQSAEVAERFLLEGRVFGTTLQMPPAAWPGSLVAFDAYWNAETAKLRVDDEVRSYLLDVARLGFAAGVLPERMRAWHQRLTIGFLPPEFRRALRVRWTDKDEAWFVRQRARLVRVERALPLAASSLVYRLLLADVRRRIRRGQPLV
ncbi:oxygenase MpaB family protein [Pseudoclavibacter terrae]|uniref:oxygenase MpaB family protein n=1 Tax=Pseudoclavibacter terrae TaxID=1530195 RepID=UPI00232DB1A2|nr:oxygenase MpaB family protein [Pseudoclavibacter terrae]